MARFAYFADLADGTTLEFVERRERIGEDRFGCARYRDVPARVSYLRGEGDDRDHLYGFHPEHGAVRITRSVQMKANPSRHECDSRCVNASGRVMNCECACGGRNHGKGRFMCEAA